MDLESPGWTWRPWESRGIVWKAVALSGNPWRHQKSCDVVWRAVVSPGGPWRPWESRGEVGSVIRELGMSPGLSTQSQGRLDVYRAVQMSSGLNKVEEFV